LKGRPNARHADGRPRYIIVDLCVRGVHHDKTIHSLVAEAFIGPRPPGFEIDHKENGGTDNRLSNLEYVTGKENNRRRDLRRALARAVSHV